MPILVLTLNERAFLRFRLRCHKLELFTDYVVLVREDARPATAQRVLVLLNSLVGQASPLIQARSPLVFQSEFDGATVRPNNTYFWNDWRDASVLLLHHTSDRLSCILTIAIQRQGLSELSHNGYLLLLIMRGAMDLF